MTDDNKEKDESVKETTESKREKAERELILLLDELCDGYLASVI